MKVVLEMDMEGEGVAIDKIEVEEDNEFIRLSISAHDVDNPKKIEFASTLLDVDEAKMLVDTLNRFVAIEKERGDEAE